MTSSPEKVKYSTEICNLQARLRTIDIDLEDLKKKLFGGNSIVAQTIQENKELNEKLIKSLMESEEKTNQIKRLHAKLISKDRDLRNLENISYSQKEENGKLNEKCKNLSEMLSKAESGQTMLSEMLKSQSEHKGEIKRIEKLLCSTKEHNIDLVEQGKTFFNIVEMFKHTKAILQKNTSNSKLYHEIMLDHFYFREKQLKAELSKLKFELCNTLTKEYVYEEKQYRNVNQVENIPSVHNYSENQTARVGISRIVTNVYEKFTCQLCDTTFHDLELLKSHMKEKQHDTRSNHYKCKLCGIENLNMKDLFFHWRDEQHLDNIAKMVAKKIPEANVNQPCYVRLNDVESLKLEIVGKDQITTLICTCTFCNTKFYRTNNIYDAIYHIKKGNSVSGCEKKLNKLLRKKVDTFEFIRDL